MEEIEYSNKKELLPHTTMYMTFRLYGEPILGIKEYMQYGLFIRSSGTDKIYNDRSQNNGYLWGWDGDWKMHEGSFRRMKMVCILILGWWLHKCIPM